MKWPHSARSTYTPTSIFIVGTVAIVVVSSGSVMSPPIPLNDLPTVMSIPPAIPCSEFPVPNLRPPEFPTPSGDTS